MICHDSIPVRDFFRDQLEAWPEASSRYEALKNVETKTIDVDGFSVTVQFNPARIRSSAARTDATSISARPCFLCDENRPSQQRSIGIDGYKILVNPFPIMPFHLTIPADCHTPQLIGQRFADMGTLARRMSQCTLFYNGPKCGASAPDHFHFQAVETGALPLIAAVENGTHVPFGIIVMDDDNATRFNEIMAALPREADDSEPKINLFRYLSPATGDLRTIIIPRRCHRPDFYGNGDGQMLVSPASVDLAGIVVAPRPEDFEMFNRKRLETLFAQLCYSGEEINEFIR